MKRSSYPVDLDSLPVDAFIRYNRRPLRAEREYRAAERYAPVYDNVPCHGNASSTKAERPPERPLPARPRPRREDTRGWPPAIPDPPMQRCPPCPPGPVTVSDAPRVHVLPEDVVECTAAELEAQIRHRLALVPEKLQAEQRELMLYEAQFTHRLVG